MLPAKGDKMGKLNQRQVGERALQLLEDSPAGLRWSEVLRRIQDESPETPSGTIRGSVRLAFQRSKDVVKVAQGAYQLAKYQEAQASVAAAEDEAAASTPVIVETRGHTKVTLLESDFYASFAEWLVEGADEVTVAVPLGGSVLKGKWGTPDVIGVLRPRVQDLLKFEPQIVSAEIKIDPNQPVIAFGQAIAYRLFSHKSYIVLPDTTSQDDLSRLKALCSIHGVGLVTFTLDTSAPDYSVIVLPQQASPDMFYANQMLRRLLESSQPLFNALFG